MVFVIIGGMPRSGSTFSFNIARETLNSRGTTLSMPVDSLSGALASYQGEEHLIIKSHCPNGELTKLIESGAAVCICTYRRPIDAVVSWVEAFEHSEQYLVDAIDLLERWLQWHSKIARHALNLPFSDIERHPLKTVVQIRKVLGVRHGVFDAIRLRRRYGKSLIKEKIDNLAEGSHTVNIGFSYYDRATLFHRRHISSRSRSAEELVPVSQLKEIRSRLARYLDENGQYIPKR